MKKIVIALILSMVLIKVSEAQLPGDFYSIDISHSILEFKIRHIGFRAVKGNFNNYSGMIYFNPDDILETSASIIIESESLDTRSSRDPILKEEFFQTEKYPYLKFYSTVTIQRGGAYFLIGNLTIGGITKEVEIPFELIAGPVKDQFKHIRIAFTGVLTIDRREYEIYYRSNEFWDNIIEDSVDIEIETGARIYNSVETVFPFRAHSIGRLSFEAYQEGGIEAARKIAEEVLVDPENHLISHRQMIRGATHLAQSGNRQGALELLDVGISVFENKMKPGDKAKYLSMKAKHLSKLGRYSESKQFAIEALKDDSLNILALEVLKHVSSK